ncbi:HK97-gp10 family putative phage morphogenesis protein [Pleionea sp. CnH1-48]|uniref:HK97-gp10 family putative phage morphogenesis protein n=1 Tax=Pleionea sp. CnH1-48 TaxID=2954494 RepID=UPI002096B0DF|nr:HK97-gp10 family putative phage morphogenesis protein [Pleionea sp. CnH1-48]MCO7225773.1 HK97 gp10 family phage protein [Pleionea sp. CnH1-48]
MKMDFKVDGLREIEKALLELEAKVSAKALRAAGRKAMKPVREDVINGAGFDPLATSKHMRDDIKMSARVAGRRSTKTALSVTVFPHKSHNHKAIAQEFGTERQSAKPFLRPALDNNASLVISIFTQEVRKAIEKINKKNGK